jgi:HD superfamily phosphohydrolase
MFKKNRADMDILRGFCDEALRSRVEQQAAEITRLKALETKLNQLEKNSLDRVREDNRNLWFNAESTNIAHADILIEDPIYRSVVIEKQIAPIFLHPIVQRLNYVKQLSFSYRSYPTATHSRLSHCLGVCKNAELILDRIFSRGVFYTDNGPQPIDLTNEEKKRYILKAKVAALLHDLGHGPFGHGLDLLVSAILEEPSPDKFFTPKYIREILGETIKECGFDPDEIANLLDKNKRADLEPFDLLVSSIIDSPLDADRMDYLLRDAHITGLSIGNVNILALIERTSPFEETVQKTGKKSLSLTYDESAIPYIAHLLYARDSMYLHCYEHPKKVSSERMLIKASAEFLERHRLHVDDLMLLTDEELIRILMQFSEKSSYAYNYAAALFKNLEFLPVYSISPSKWNMWQEKQQKKSNGASFESEQDEEDRGIETLDEPPKPSGRVREWETGRLQYKARHLSRPNEWEEEIVKAAGIAKDEYWKVLVTVPPAGMFEPKYNEIRILREKDGKYYAKKLDKIADYWEGVLRFLAVERSSIRVFAAETLSADKVKAVEEASRQLLEEPKS